ncbi:MAG: response regulator transcription factor [Nitrosomonadales bacterium]|nr:response regulator transcription factor [Nitrosomonadales bacterium]
MRFAALDDDISELELIKKSITSIGHECHTFSKGELLIKTLRRESFDFLILDWELPGMTGLDIIKWVRENHKEQIPILLVTNRRDERDVVYGLAVGADDFMVKPVRVGELLARVKALIRRSRPNHTPQNHEWGRYRFMLDSHMIEYLGQSISLKNKEFELALFLFQNLGRLLSRQHLQEQIWGTQITVVNSRSLDTHISSIRNKLFLRPENGYHLISVYGFGYRLEAVSNEKPETQ